MQCKPKHSYMQDMVSGHDNQIKGFMNKAYNNYASMNVLTQFQVRQRSVQITSICVTNGTKQEINIKSHVSSISGGEFHLLAGNIISGKIENDVDEKGVTTEVIGGNHTRAAMLMLYDGLNDEEALKIGLHHNEVNK